MNKTLIRIGAATLMGCTSLFAHAANVTLTGWTYGTGNEVSVSTPVFSGQAGGFTGSLTGSGAFDTNVFDTYCVELSEEFSFGAAPMTNYAVVTGARYFGTDKSLRLGKLVTYVNSHPSQVNNSAASTSLQLAIWNLIYDSDSSVSGPSTPGNRFHDSSPYDAQANFLMAQADKVISSEFDIYALEKSGSQDFLLTSRTAHSQGQKSVKAHAVAEPDSLALAGFAILSMALTTRRRARKKA